MNSRTVSDLKDLIEESNKQYHTSVSKYAFEKGGKYIHSILTTRLHSFLTHLCDTNVIDCHSAEEIVKKWEEWER